MRAILTKLGWFWSEGDLKAVTEYIFSCLVHPAELNVDDFFKSMMLELLVSETDYLG